MYSTPAKSVKREGFGAWLQPQDVVFSLLTGEGVMASAATPSSRMLNRLEPVAHRWDRASRPPPCCLNTTGSDRPALALFGTREFDTNADADA